MEHVRTLPALKLEEGMDVNWQKWRQQFLIFLKTSGLIDQPTKLKASLLLSLVGSIGSQAFKTFEFESSNDSENMDILLKKFDDYFRDAKTTIEYRNIFFSSVKHQTETIDEYVNALKIKAKTCNFGELVDSLIRDKIILDTENPRFKKHLLKRENLTLNELVDLWKLFEPNASAGHGLGTSDKLRLRIIPH